MSCGCHSLKISQQTIDVDANGESSSLSLSLSPSLTLSRESKEEVTETSKNRFIGYPFSLSLSLSLPQACLLSLRWWTLGPTSLPLYYPIASLNSSPPLPAMGFVESSLQVHLIISSSHHLIISSSSSPLHPDDDVISLLSLSHKPPPLSPSILQLLLP
jgi:hypothetical protein